MRCFSITCLFIILCVPCFNNTASDNSVSGHFSIPEEFILDFKKLIQNVNRYYDSETLCNESNALDKYAQKQEDPDNPDTITSLILQYPDRPLDTLYHHYYNYFTVVTISKHFFNNMEKKIELATFNGFLAEWNQQKNTIKRPNNDETPSTLFHIIELYKQCHPRLRPSQLCQLQWRQKYMITYHVKILSDKNPSLKPCVQTLRNQLLMEAPYAESPYYIEAVDRVLEIKKSRNQKKDHDKSFCSCHNRYSASNNNPKKQPIDLTHYGS